MAIIDNHKEVKIDRLFTDKHSEMFAFFDTQNIDVEVSDDFESFQAFLEGLSDEDYPYNYDMTFNGVVVDGFNLRLIKDNNIIATYAAKWKDVIQMQNDFIDYFQEDDLLQSPILPIFEGKQLYSSCQWVSKDYRGNKFGMILDHLKKNICFDIFEADIQYAMHKEPLKDYHINNLHYSDSQWLGTIPNGEVYNVAWITKETWTDKLNDIRKLY